jgi:hypothetical protein
MPDSTVPEPKGNEDGERSPDRASQGLCAGGCCTGARARNRGVLCPRCLTRGVSQPAPSQGRCSRSGRLARSRVEGQASDRHADHRGRERRLVRSMRRSGSDLDRHACDRLRHAQAWRSTACPLRTGVRVQRRADLASTQLRLLRPLVIRLSPRHRWPRPHQDRAASGRAPARRDHL